MGTAFQRVVCHHAATEFCARVSRVRPHAIRGHEITTIRYVSIIHIGSSFTLKQGGAYALSFMAQKIEVK